MLRLISLDSSQPASGAPPHIPPHVTILKHTCLGLIQSLQSGEYALFIESYLAMSSSESNSSSGEMKNLHLGKFVPVGEDDPPLPQDDGQTMMIRRIAAETAERTCSEEEVQSDEFGLPLKEMLGVISHCYVKGVFCSKDIAALIRQEPALREALGRRLPSEEVVRRFRRHYAEAIEETLEGLYRVVPPESGPGNTEIIHRQAVERVHEAAWTDNTRGRLG